MCNSWFMILGAKGDAVNGNNGDTGRYVRLETPEDCTRFAMESVRAMLDLTPDEAFKRQDAWAYAGTIIDHELLMLRQMLGR